MEKLLDNLHIMICSELEDASKKGISSHDDVDLIKDLIESIKNIYEIHSLTNQEPGMSSMGGSSYAMRRSYAPMRGSYTGEYSYAKDGSNSYNDGMSYGDRNYERYARGYSSATKAEMLDELKRMVNETNNMEVKAAVSDCINRMENR